MGVASVASASLPSVRYAVKINHESGLLRVMHEGTDGTELSYQEFDAPGAYAFAQALLKGYDKLEGID